MQSLSTLGLISSGPFALLVLILECSFLGCYMMITRSVYCVGKESGGGGGEEALHCKTAADTRDVANSRHVVC